MKHFLTHIFRPGTGRTVPSASCQVKVYPSTMGDANATVYSDSAGTLPITQPFLANGNGMIAFYAPNGRYDLYFSIPDPSFGTITYAWNDVVISDPQTQFATDLDSVRNPSYILAAPSADLVNSIPIPTFLGHPDKLPASPTTYDNEWTSFGSPWAGFNTNAYTNISTANSRLTLYQFSAPVTNPAVGVTRPFSGLPPAFMLTSLIRLGYDPGTVGGVTAGGGPLWGLGIRSSLGEIATISIGGSAQGISVYRADYNSGGLVTSNAYQQIGANYCYVRIRLKASVYTFEWSLDGFTYTLIDKVAAGTLFAGTLSEMGLFSYATFETGGSVNCISDFVRFSVNINDLLAH